MWLLKFEETVETAVLEPTEDRLSDKETMLGGLRGRKADSGEETGGGVGAALGLLRFQNGSERSLSGSGVIDRKSVPSAVAKKPAWGISGVLLPAAVEGFRFRASSSASAFASANAKLDFAILVWASNSVCFVLRSAFLRFCCVLVDTTSQFKAAPARSASRAQRELTRAS